MKKQILLGIVIALLISTTLVTAIQPENTPSNKNNDFTIPKHAKEIAPGVYDLGTKSYKGDTVQGYAFVDYKKGYGKPSGCNNDGVCQGWEDADCPDCQGGGDPPQDDDCKCYDFMSKGAKWKTVEPYVINPSNNQGLNEGAIVNNFASDIEKWESAAGKDIIGSGTVTDDLLFADTIYPDNLNEVYFGSISQPGVIAVTIVWGIFSAPPPRRQLVEWDQIYNQDDFDWSLTGEAGKMDFESIATHELGHSVGLDDLYTSTCFEQTMYGYAENGETKKRTLECGDINGVSGLYK